MKLKIFILALTLLGFSLPVTAKECPTNSFKLEKASKKCKVKRFCDSLFANFEHDLVMFYRYNLGIEKIGRDSRVIDLNKDQHHDYDMLRKKIKSYIKILRPKTAVYNDLCMKE